MNNKAKNTCFHHQAIRTKHVFNKDEQVYLRTESQDSFLDDTLVAEWFPTNFKWEPVRI